MTNGRVIWSSRRQQLTALSTTEAEVNALADAAKQAKVLRDLCTEMKLVEANSRVLVREDNSACLALVNGSRTPSRTRHIASRIGFIRDLITTKVMEVVACSTIDMVADPLTKPLGPIEFRRKPGYSGRRLPTSLPNQTIAHHTTALTRGRVLSHAPHGHGHVRLRPTVRSR